MAWWWAAALAAAVWPLAQAALSEADQACVAGAHRHEKAGWIYLHIQGSPQARGFQYGYLLAPEIDQKLRAHRIAWRYNSGMEWSWLVEKAAAMFTPRIDPENLAELDGLAAGLKAAGRPATREELIVLNGWLELAGYWWPQELRKLKDAPPPPLRESCSAFIATGRMTAGGGIVLAHNSMDTYEEANANIILDVAPDRGRRMLMQTWPGWVHSGTDFFVTDAGLIGAETTIGEFEGFDPQGIPEFARARRAMQDAGTIDQWCAIMKKGNNGGYANAWLLGDVNSGEIARLELGLKHVGFERKRDGYFTGSNVAEDLKLLRFETGGHETDIRLSAVARRERWKQLMARHAGKIDARLAQKFEADHFDCYLGKERPGSRTLCGHFELEPEPGGPWPGVPFAPAGTFDAKVVDSQMAKRMAFLARWGSACGTPFDARKFLAAHPQFDWLKEILPSRPSQPWVEFRAGEK